MVLVPAERHMRQSEGYNMQHSGHTGQRFSKRTIQVKDFQKELMVEIYSKSLVRGIDKVLLIKYSENTN